MSGKFTRRQRRGPTDGTWTQASIALIALGSLLVAVATAGSFSVTTARTTTVNPNESALIAGLLIAGLGVVGVMVTAVMAIVRWREDMKPPLTIVHDAEDPDCFQDNENGSCQFRVKVTNNGRVALRKVRVRVVVLEPKGKHTHFLHIRHDDYSHYQRSWDGENVQVGDPAFFDVVWRCPPGEDCIVLNYAADYLSNSYDIPVTLKLRLTASAWLGDGRDVPPTTADCVVVATADKTTLTCCSSRP